MTAEEIRHEVFQALYEKWVENEETPKMFVGLQGDKIVLMQPGGEHYALVVHPAVVEVAS